MKRSSRLECERDAIKTKMRPSPSPRARLAPTITSPRLLVSLIEQESTRNALPTSSKDPKGRTRDQKRRRQHDVVVVSVKVDGDCVVNRIYIMPLIWAPLGMTGIEELSVEVELAGASVAVAEDEIKDAAVDDATVEVATVEDAAVDDATAEDAVTTLLADVKIALRVVAEG